MSLADQVTPARYAPRHQFVCTGIPREMCVTLITWSNSATRACDVTMTYTTLGGVGVVRKLGQIGSTQMGLFKISFSTN